ncbi:MAG: PLP-dependent aminotransferase family protein [Candidatus Sericytochromatia bacterium]
MTYLYAQLQGDLREMIQQGTLQPGERLPSLRQMQRSRGVSLATVMQAYTLLEAEGWIETRPQSGFYVKHLPRHPLPHVAPGRVQPSRVQADAGVQSFLAAARQPGMLVLGSTTLHPALLPTGALTRSLQQQLRHENYNVYAQTQGEAELRRQIALRSADSERPLVPDELVITSGCMEALTLSLRCVAQPGDVIAVESPTFYGILQTIEGQGMRVLELPTDPVLGLDFAGLQTALERHPIRALITVPSFQNPLGFCMSVARKRELLALLTTAGVAVIEDDIYGEFYRDQPPPTLRSLDPSGQVMLCSSFSKTLAPGLRIGWAAPGPHHAAFLQQKRTHNLASCTLSQRALADYLQRGSYERHLRRLRRQLNQQRSQMLDAVASAFPAETRISQPQGGVSLWLELPPGSDARALSQRALAAGIVVAPGSLFSASGQDYAHCLRLSCAVPWGPEVASAIAQLGRWAKEAGSFS